MATVVQPPMNEMQARITQEPIMKSRHIIAIAGFALFLAGSAVAGSSNGSAGQTPAYYDSQLFTINLMMLSSNASISQLQHNGSINIIYESDGGLPDNQPFIPVLNAIQTDGFNPIWQEVQIVFNSGFTPHQFGSDDQINAAAAAGEITLIPTNDVYRCSVVGSK